MKSGWPTKRLADVCEIIMGQSPKGDSYNTTGEGVPLINGPVEFSKDSFGKTVRSKFTTQPTKYCKEGDLILCVRGSTTGRMNIAGFGACIGRGVAAIRAKQYQPWINHFISSKRNEIHGKGTGATFPNVSGTTLANFRLVVPPIPEQKRIVAILDEAFAGIAQAVAHAEKNLANARELFESYLNSIFTWKSESNTVQLSEITTDITDGDHSAPPKSPEGIPFITISNINKSTRVIDFSNTFKVPIDYFNNLKPNRRPMAGDVLFTVTGSYGIPVKVPTGVEFCFQRHIGLLRPKTGIDSSWLYYALLSPITFRQATEGATGAAQKTVSLRVLRGIRVPIMSQKEQAVVVESLDKIWGETQRLESIYQQKLTALTELKQSILQKAFSGELTAGAVLQQVNG